MTVFQKIKIVIVLVCITTGISCNDTTKQASSSLGTSYANKFDNPKWVEKYSEYITFYNEINQALIAPMDRYHTDIPETGPKKGLNIGLISLEKYPSEELVEAQAIALEIPELDSIAVSVNKDFSALAQVVNDAKTYYDRKDYEGDKYAKGKEYHQLVNSNTESLLKDINLMKIAIDELDKELTVAEFSRYEKEGLMMRYHMAKLINFGKEAQGFAAVESIEAFAKTDTTQVNRVIQDLIKTIDAATELGKNEEQFTKEFNYAPAKFHYKSMITQSNRMVSNLRSLKTNIKKQKFTRSGFLSPTASDGLPDAISENYEKMVNDYNALVR